MDFDGENGKGFINWKHEEKDMKNLRTITAVFAPAVALCYMFSVNVIKLDEMKRLPAVEKKIELTNLVEDTKGTWYAQIHNKELKSKALAKR